LIINKKEEYKFIKYAQKKRTGLVKLTKRYLKIKKNSRSLFLKINKNRRRVQIKGNVAQKKTASIRI
jgi:hypothetical protein